jgi:hypothetical protein
MSKDRINESNSNLNPGSTIAERTSLTEDLDVEDRFTPVAFRVLGGDSPEEGRSEPVSAATVPD